MIASNDYESILSDYGCKEGMMHVDSVMVRAYKDEPVQLAALEVATTYVIVAGTDRTKTIGFPRDCVFRFDNGLFARLRMAYEKGSAATLSKLWAMAEPL
jgi:hypothetical protein